MLFLNQLFQNFQTYSEKIAIEFHSEKDITRVSYTELEKNILGAAQQLLSLGVRRGDRLALQLPKSLAFVYYHLAAMRLGAISLPLNPAFPASELEYFLKDSAAKIFITDASQEASLRGMLAALTLEHCVFLDASVPFSAIQSDLALPDFVSDEHATALMIYTSGTTGRPKGAELSHENLTAGIEALHNAWAWVNNDVLLHVLPIFHTHGLMVALHGALHAGASTVMLEKFDAAKTLELLSSKRFSVFMAVPTIHGRLLAEAKGKHDLSHMRLMTSGSARLPDDVFEAFQKTFGYTLLERYGMTETGMNLSNPYEGERRVGSVGLPLGGVEARVVNPANNELLADGDIGEVQVRGKHVFKGYWQQAQKTAEAFTTDGWLKTGDLGLREPDGYFVLKGRSKDLIISGGFNIYPPEVELVLSQHPMVAASAVIGCPDSDWGERVIAVIELKEGVQENEAAIDAFCKQYLANYKAPKAIFFVPELPKNAMGKVQKAELRKTFCNSN